MPIISEFLYNSFAGQINTSLLLDPLNEEDVLLEATLLSTMGWMLNDSFAFLFDLRTAMYMGQGNTGLLIARKVLEVKFSPFQPKNFYYVWMVGTSKVTAEGQYYSINLDDQIHVKSLEVEFIAGTVDNIGEVANSIDDGLNTYLEITPNWNSDIKVVGSTYLAASQLPTP
jgi:hypothetical protein